MPKMTKFPVLLVCLGFFVAGQATIGMARDAPPPAKGAAVEEDVDLVPPQIILKTQKAPEYPPAAYAARFSGEVTLEFTVLKDGTVSDEMRVVECTHRKVGFEEAVAKAVKEWRFTPALADGEPIDYTRTVKLTFRGTATGVEPFVTVGTSGAVPSSDQMHEVPSQAPTGRAPVTATRKTR